MGVANSLVNAFNVLEGSIRPEIAGRDLKFLTIGTMDFHVTKNCLKKYGINTIKDDDLKNHYSAIGEERNRSSKRLCAKLFQHYGYKIYEELDINKRADVLFNLNYPIPSELENKYDFMLNVSAHYAMNAIQAFFNTASMVKIGGKIMVVSVLGDMTNRFYLNPSPNFLIDFYRANGFVLEKAIMQNKRGHAIPYVPTKYKVTWIGAIIPFRFFLFYHFRKFIVTALLRITLGKQNIVNLVLSKKKRKKSDASQINQEVIQQRKSSIKNRLQVLLGERGFNQFRKFVGFFQRIESCVTQSIDPDWNVWCVFKKVENIKEPRFEIIERK